MYLRFIVDHRAVGQLHLSTSKYKKEGHAVPSEKERNTHCFSP